MAQKFTLTRTPRYRKSLMKKLAAIQRPLDSDGYMIYPKRKVK